MTKADVVSKVKTTFAVVSAILVVGWVAHADYKMQKTAETRMRTLEARVDSLYAKADSAKK